MKRIVNGGGIAAKNPVAMQIYADVMGRAVSVTRSQQTCALGSAIAGAVVAGENAGGHKDFAGAISAMASPADRTFTPNPQAAEVYNQLYVLYRRLHDAFGTAETMPMPGQRCDEEAAHDSRCDAEAVTAFLQNGNRETACPSTHSSRPATG